MNHFTAMESYLEAIEGLPEEIQGEVSLAIWRYGIRGELPEKGTTAYGIVAAIRPLIDKGKEISVKRGQSSRKQTETNAEQTKTNEEQIKTNEEQIKTNEEQNETNADKGKVKVKDKVKDKENKDIMSSAASVLDALNRSADRQFKAVDGTLKPILARLREGRTEAECLEIIRKKVAEWKGDPKMDAYLRPETLFSAQHFDSYLNAPEINREERPPNKFHNFDERKIDYDAIIRGEAI